MDVTNDSPMVPSWTVKFENSILKPTLKSSITSTITLKREREIDTSESANY
jgi:hypothetical protein